MFDYLDFSSLIATVIDTFSRFYRFFFSPIDNPVISGLFGNVSLFGIVFGGGLLVYVVYQLVTWVLNVLT